jgi:UDP-N-acetylmuramoyl-tripeptide--D-alanyl-D-alanine ligase
MPTGCLFLALKGAHFDGHSFVKRAIENGAVAAVVESPIEGCPCLVVPDTGRALLRIAAYYRKKFSPILVGVTGSVGKTTTKEMIALVLSSTYRTLKTQGNLNNEIGLPKTLMELRPEHGGSN